MRSGTGGWRALLAGVAMLGCGPGAMQAQSFAMAVEVSLSPKAAATLRRLSEGIVVSVTYSGEPKPSAMKHADQIGQIDLGRETVTVRGRARTVQVTGGKVDRSRLAWIQGPVLVNVNVYSARRSGPDNILSCDFFDGKLENAVSAPVALRCSLITEKAETKAKS